MRQNAFTKLDSKLLIRIAIVIGVIDVAFDLLLDFAQSRFLNSGAEWLFTGAKVIVAGSVAALVVRKFIFEPAARTSALRSSAIFDSMVEGVVLQDENGKIYDLNPSAERILGLTREQILGRDSIDPRWKCLRADGTPFPGDEHPAMIALRTGQIQRDITMGIVHADQKTVWIQIQSVPLQSPTSVVTTFNDVTDYIVEHRENLILKDRFSTAIEAIRFGVWDWNLKTGTLIWDGFMYQLFEINKADFAGDYDAFERTLLPEDAKRLQLELELHFKNRRTEFNSEFRIRTTAGHIKYIAARAKCFYDSEGNIEKLTGCNWDQTELVTNQKKLNDQQESLFQSARLAALGRMAGGIGHEINTPLGVIHGRAMLLQMKLVKQGLLTEEFQDDLNKIMSTTDRIALIIKGMKQLVRESNDDARQDVALRTIFDETISVCMARFRAAGIEFDPGTLPDLVMHANPVQISQVLLNLLNNAIDAVVTADVKKIEIRCLERIEDKMIELSVMNSGNGIDPKIAAHIFDPFFTTKEPGKGTGLGLSISRTICESHGGKLFYDPDFVMTRFVALLPLK